MLPPRSAEGLPPASPAPYSSCTAQATPILPIRIIFPGEYARHCHPLSPERCQRNPAALGGHPMPL